MLKKDVGVVVDWFDDMVAFVELVRSNPTISSSSIVSTLAHDLGGLIRQEKCFLPRTAGYTKHLERRREAEAKAESGNGKKTPEQKLQEVRAALRWVLDDQADAGEAKNRETGETFDSIANAEKVYKETA